MANKRTTGRPMGRPKRQQPIVKRNVTIPSDLDGMVAGMASHTGLSYSGIVSAILRAWYETNNPGGVLLGSTPDTTITIPLTWRPYQDSSNEETHDTEHT